MFAIAASLPAMVLIPINIESMHAYYSYSLPVAGSTVVVYDIVYFTVEEEDYRYAVDLFFYLNSTLVSEYVGKDTPSYMMAISNITLLGDGSILVDYADNGYAIGGGSGGPPKWRMPPFSHAEVIRVNQTFVAVCIDLPRPEDSEYYDSTGIAVFQYLGVEEHNVTSVVRYHYVSDSMPEGGGTSQLPDGTLVDKLATGAVVPKGAGVAQHGDMTYISTHEPLSPPRIMPVYKFLFMSGYTHTKMPCDYPQVIDHTVDSKRVDPADIRAIGDQMYQWYKWQPRRIRVGHARRPKGGRAVDGGRTARMPSPVLSPSATIRPFPTQWLVRSPGFEPR